MTTPLALQGPYVAYGPLNTIDPADVLSVTQKVDAWLREISGGYVTLERVEMVLGNIPVVGNIINLVDAIWDIVEIARKKEEEVGIFDWVNLGVDVIGVIPGPTQGVCSSMRIGVKAAREGIKDAMKMGAKHIGEAILKFIENELFSKAEGALIKFVEEGLTQFEGLLQQAAKTIKGVLDNLADLLTDIVNGHAFHAEENIREMNKEAELASKNFPTSWDVTSGKFWHNVGSSFDHASAAAGQYVKAGIKESGNAASSVVAAVLSEKSRRALVAIINTLRKMGIQAASRLPALLKSEVEGSLGWILTKLLASVKARLTHTKTGATAKANATTKAENHVGNGRGETISGQAPTKNASGCKDCKAGSGSSISYAMGWERFSHQDFSLAAVIPLAWQRNYASNASTFDHGPLGARWLGEWFCRFEQQGTSLVYRAPDGRPLPFPEVAPGKQHYDAIEMLTLERVSDQELVLHLSPTEYRKFERTEQADRVVYRLTAHHWANKFRLQLHYHDAASALRHAPSDLVLSHGDKVQAQARCILDEAGRIVQIDQLLNRQFLRTLARYQYDDHGDLVRATDENGASRDYSYHRHLVTRYTDRTGRGMNLRWQGADAPDNANARAVSEWADDGSFAISLAWDPNIRMTLITDALQQVTRHYNDILGYTYRIVHPDGRNEWFYRDDAKNVVQHIHPDGTADRYVWDAKSRLRQHIRADGQSVYFDHDEMDNVITIVDPDRYHWKRDYNTDSQLVEETDPLGHKTEYTYNKAGQVVEITDATGKTKQISYTPTGQIAGYTDCSGKTSAWKYDNRGRLSAYTDASGATTRYHYTQQATLNAGDLPSNAPGQLERIVYADNSAEHFVYDAEGRLLGHTNPLGATTQYDYSAAGLITRRKDAMGHTLGYQWDKLGRLTILTNENAAQWHFHYDPVGRLLKEVGFDGQTTRYGYGDMTGTLQASLQLPAQSAKDAQRCLMTRFDFDPMGRLNERRAHWSTPYGEVLNAQGKTVDTTHAGAVHVEEYGYDATGRLALAKNACSMLQWFYDPAGRMVREHHDYTRLGKVAVWQHEYDELGNRTATTRPDGHRVDWQRYGSGHVHGLLLDGQEHIAFERDDLHRETGRRQGNQLQQTKEYDPVGRLLQQSLKAIAKADGPGGSSTGSTVYIQRGYRYDALGQLSQIEDNRRGMISYRYDPIGRLTQAHSLLGKETFAFDPASNLLDSEYQGNQGLPYSSEDTAMQNPRPGTFGLGNKQGSGLMDNLLKDYVGQHNEYDGLGYLVSRTINGDKTFFRWNPLGRLEESNHHRVNVEYNYDALGRRISKHSQAFVATNYFDGPGYAPLRRKELAVEHGYGLSVYGWDGDHLAWESMVEGGYTATTHYVYEPDSFVPLLQATTEQAISLPTRKLLGGGKVKGIDPHYFEHGKPTAFDQVAWYTCDHLGTPQELTDQDGNLVWSANYTAWGKTHEAISTARKKAGLSSRIRFQGQFFDTETGLHYNRYRYYDPHCGRFISKDPIGLRGGENLQQYAPSPTNWVDPYGLVTSLPLPASEAADLARFRVKAGLPAYIEGDESTGTVAKAVGCDGKTAYGLNSKFSKDRETRLGGLDALHEDGSFLGSKHLGHAPVLTHAEGQALLRLKKKGGCMKNIKIYSDRKTCKYCKSSLDPLAHALGVNNLKVYSGAPSS